MGDAETALEDTGAVEATPADAKGTEATMEETGRDNDTIRETQGAEPNGSGAEADATVSSELASQEVESSKEENGKAEEENPIFTQEHLAKRLKTSDSPLA